VRDKENLRRYVSLQESLGNTVYYPERDTDQSASSVIINSKNARAIALADQVHVYWNPKSFGSHFDLGIAYAEHKPIVLVNELTPTIEKSYTNLVLALSHPDMMIKLP
jgi:hypothetical protein